MNTPVPTPILEESRATALERASARTPARIMTGRSGGSYPTEVLLSLRADHAAARDAVAAELDLERDLGKEFVHDWGLFEAGTQARSKQEYLLCPEMGRKLEPVALTELKHRCPAGCDVQIVIGDGLSAPAVAAQVPVLLPLLRTEIDARGWSWGQPFVIRHCRVGVLNDLGDLLDPAVAVLLIGERPGLATAQSLSAYMAYHPRSGHDDSHRNLISNIHARGVSAVEAARRIAVLAGQMMRLKASGVVVKEEWSGSNIIESCTPARRRIECSQTM